jgi:PsbP-like protein
MDQEHQSLVIGAIVLLLIINTTVLYSFVTSQGMNAQSAAPAQNNSSAALLKDQAVNASGTKVPATPTVTPTSTKTPANASAAAPAGSAKTNVSAHPSAPRYLSYANTSYTFSIDYPANWTMAEMNPALLKTVNATRLRSETGIRVVEFYSPSITRCDDTVPGNCVLIRTRVSVDVASFPQNMTFDEYFVNQTLAMTLDNSVGMRRASPVVTLNNTKAYSLEYNAGYGLNQVYVTKVFGLFNDKVYIITYRANFPKTGEENQFEKYYNDFQHMLKSFEYTGQMQYL